MPLPFLNPYTKTINGITINFTPSVKLESGPSNQPIEFTSQIGTSASKIITATFDKPVGQFVVSVVGQTYPNHILRAYNEGGVLIAEVQGTSNILDQGSGGSTLTQTITAPQDQIIAKVELVPPTGDYIGYKDVIAVQSSVSLPPPNQNTSIIQIDKSVIDRSYTKGTMTDVASEVVHFTNVSSDTTMNVTLDALAGITFNPSTFSLPKNSMQPVTINFDVPTIESLSEGLHTIQVAINLNGYTTVPLPPTGTPKLTWVEQRFHGSPLQPLPNASLADILQHKLPTDAELFSNPFLTQTISNIDYSGSLTAPVTIRWTQEITTPLPTTYRFTFTTDDGMRIFIDNTLVSDQWRAQSPKSYTVDVPVSVGAHTIKVEYFNDRGPSTAKLNYYATNVFAI